jgi:predicted O-methyltransferase YrrM
MSDTITDRLMGLDPTLQRHNEGHWDKPFDPEMGGFSSFNDAGIECETGEFLYSLIRLLKPEQVMETGTHWGIGAAYMGMALEDNKKGYLDTFEFLQEIHVRANQRMDALGLLGTRVKTYLKDVATVIPETQYQLILLDTEPQTRFSEMVRFDPYLAEGGFLFIHDLHRHMHQIPNEEHGFAWPFWEIPEVMKAFVNHGIYRPFHFSTPRGLTGFYKVSEKDYKWI